jgi:large subunit ribosomal protein L6
VSRIGKLPIPIPAGVRVQIDGNKVTVTGPKGELTREFRPELQISVEGSIMRVARPNDEQSVRALHGLTRALLNNMVLGVTNGYTKVLEVLGTGYRAELQGKTLVMNLGLSHSVVIEPPDGIQFEVNPRTSTITVRGCDKEVVGRIAAEIRGWRPVEPYLGKGIRYQGELVRRKAGKAGKAK